jgi:hypothetical protein
MKSDLKELIVCEGMIETEIIKSKLRSFDIPCLVQFETAGRLYGITIDGLGKTKIMVNKEDYERALELIEEEGEANARD